MRAMREPARMQRNHARMDVVTRKEIPSVIENHFVEVVVVVEERHFDRARISLERTRHEGADDETLRDERGVRARRQMVAMRNQRPDDRKSDGQGKVVLVRGVPGGSRIINKKN